MEVIEELPKIKAKLEIGALVIADSKYTGFRTDAFDNQFESIGKAELSQMGRFHTFFMDISNLYQGNTVHGWAKAVIMSVEPIVGGELRIHYQAGGISGSRSTKSGRCKEFVRAIDESKLLRLVESMPLSQIVFVRRT